MKKLAIYMFLLTLISSCVEVIFEQAQPIETESVKTFPKTIQGKYIDDNNDTLIIEKISYRYGNEKDIFHIKSQLSDNIILKIHGNYYFLNEKSDTLWNLIVLELQNDNKLLILTIFGDEQEKIEKLKKITNVKEVYDSDGEIDCYIVNPTKSELEKMLKKKVFTEFGVFKRISK